MTKLFLSAIFVCFFFLFHFAQLSQWMNDPEIEWIASFTTDYRFDPSSPPYSEATKIIQFKSSPENFKGGNPGKFLPQQLFKVGFEKGWPCYTDAALTIPLQREDLEGLFSSTDTIVTFDPNSNVETTRVVKSEMDLEKIRKVRIKQVIYFNATTEQFQTSVLAVAPLFQEHVEDDPQPLFWLAMNSSFPADFDPYHPDIHFGALTYSFEQPFWLNSMEVIKNENFNFKEKLYQQAINLEKIVESDAGYGSGRYLKQAQLRDVYTGKDTITVFDPTTFAASVKVIEHNLNYQDIDRFRLVQEWYYDGKRHIMFNRLKAIAPIHPIREEDKAKLYRALYYIRYHTEEVGKF